MSVTVSQHKNFVGGEWVDAVEGGTMEVAEPCDRRGDRRGAERDARRTSTAPSRRPRKRCPSGSRRRRASAPRRCSSSRTRSRRTPTSLPSSSRRTSASRSRYARDEMPVSADNLRFFAGAARMLEGKSAGEYMRGYTSIIRREPIGIVGGIAPWNYPLMMAVWKIGPGARRGERPGRSSRPSRRR